MNFFYILISVGAGILGTLAMTLFTELVWNIIRKPYHVIFTLSTLLQFGKRAKPVLLIHSEPFIAVTRIKTIFYALGVCLHYLIGICFAVAYIMLLTNNVIALRIGDALLFGAIAGALGVIGWQIFLKLLNDALPYSKLIYFTTIWFGHVLLAIVMYYVVLALWEKPAIVATIPLC